MSGVAVRVCRARGLSHSYEIGGPVLPALREVDLGLDDGSTLAVLGASGSGKSTLLALVAGLLRVSSGSLDVLGLDMALAGQRQLLALRARAVGVVLQNPGRNLLGHASVVDNLLFAQRAGGRPRAARRERAAELLALVDLSNRSPDRAGDLSGGEQQRLAVAVGLANSPQLLLADEPTSQLDSVSGAAVTDLLVLAAERGAAVLVVTHDPEVADRMQRVLTMADGVVVDERPGRLG